jgi:hypothetical protein
MHVLVTESTFGEAARVTSSLIDLGCQVSTCHGTTGICRAFAPGGRCPLDGGRAVDLVVDVRGGAEEFTAREYGVVCATRARLPVVLVGGDQDVPVVVPPGLESRVSETTVDGLLSACGEALAVRRRSGIDPAGAGRSTGRRSGAARSGTGRSVTA